MGGTAAGPDDELARQVAIRLMAVLYPGDAPFDPPDSWWATPLGRVARAEPGHPSRDHVWLGSAGAMLGITRQGVHDLVSRQQAPASPRRRRLRRVDPRPPRPTERTVILAAHDYDGDGPPILLLHGAGGDMSAWQTLAPLLNGRCVAVDLRGHGKSEDGPWKWDEVLDDLESTAVHFGLVDPVVVGHSLGGILAGMWACRHPGCPAAVSLDGHRSATTDPANYAGLEPDQVEAGLEKLNAVFTAQQEMITRPNREITGALRTAPEFLDALPIFGAVTSPFLLLLATRNLPVPPDLIPLMDAHRSGLRRDLPIVCPNIEVREIDAMHGMLFEQPAEVAAIVNGFIPR